MTDANAMIREGDAEFGDYFALLKPRVMSLVIFTAAVGLLVAPAGVHPVIAFAAVLFIAVGAGASGALNMWWDADIDARMRRTRGRPIPAGRVRRDEALHLGLWLSVVAVVMLGLATNWLAAGLLAFTIFFYAVIYSMWLKRRTPQNIVIGGAAGAFPPMIGWAAATGQVSVEAVLMFLLIFVWTPPHFWALALFTREDYSRAGVPMLTVTHGRDAARRHILAYTLLLVPIGPVLALSEIGGPVLMAVTLWTNLRFVRGALGILRRDDAAAEADDYACERRFFRLSLSYLFLHFLALLADAALRGLGAGAAWSGWPQLF